MHKTLHMAANATEEALRESEATVRRERAFLRTVIDSVSSLLIVRDAEGRCLLANEAAARFYGMSVQALEGRPAAEIPALPAEALQQDREVLASRREIVTELDIPGADGLVHSLMTVKTPLANARGEYDRVLATSVDITWRKRAENE